MTSFVDLYQSVNAVDYWAVAGQAIEDKIGRDDWPVLVPSTDLGMTSTAWDTKGRSIVKHYNTLLGNGQKVTFNAGELFGLFEKTLSDFECAMAIKAHKKALDALVALVREAMQ
jgi:hypothetical protein